MSKLVDLSSGREQTAWWLLQAALFTLPWIGVGTAAVVTGRDLGAGLQPSWLALALVVILRARAIVEFLAETRRSWLVAAGPLAMAVLISGLGIWVAPSGEADSTTVLRFGKQIVQLGVMLAFVVVPAFYLWRGCPLARLMRPLAWGAVFQVLYGAVQGVNYFHPLPVMPALAGFFTSNPAILSGSGQLYLSNALQDVPRLRGTACEPLYLGNYLLLALPAVALTKWPRRRQVTVAVALAALLLLTWSRGAWLAAMAAGAFWGLGSLRNGLPGWRAGSGRRLAWVGAAVVGAVALAGALGRPEVWLPWQRLIQSFSLVDWSNLTRLYSMQAAWRAFLLSPLIGIGWGQFGFHFVALVDPMGLQAMFTWPVVNNFPLEILCETGGLGGLSLIWLVWVLAGKVRQRLLAGSPGDRAAVLLLAAASLGIWVQLLTFSQYNLPHIWVALGLLCGTLGPTTATGEGQP